MRCPDCNKFASFDTETDPEVNIDHDEDGNLTGDVRIVNTCADCSTELKEGTFDVEDNSINILLEAHREEKVEELVKGGMNEGEAEAQVADQHVIEDIDTADEQRSDRMETKDRHGKPIKNSRYMKHLYGYSIEVTATCKCGETFTTTLTDEIQASSMEELT